MRTIKLTKKINRLADIIDSGSVQIAKLKLDEWLNVRCHDANFPKIALEPIKQSCRDIINVLSEYDDLTMENELETLVTPLFLHKIVVKCADYMYVTKVEVVGGWVLLNGPKVRMYESDGTVQLEVASKASLPIEIRIFKFKFSTLDSIRIVSEKEYLAEYAKYEKALKLNISKSNDFAKAIKGTK